MLCTCISIRQNQKNLKFHIKNLKLGTLKCTRELHKPERIRMRIVVNCILMLSAVFWSAQWAVTTGTAMHGLFAPAETRTQHMCTCLYSCMYSCVVTAHQTRTWTESLPYQCTTKIICVSSCVSLDPANRSVF